MGRWLGIDYGGKRIGVAAGRSEDGIASPLTIITAGRRSEELARIRQIAEEYQAAGIVVGWPLNMDDSEGPQGKSVRAFAAELAQASGLDVRLWDERLSSFSADQAMAGWYTRKKKKARQDAVAAAMILQDFFACGGPQSAPKPGDIPD